MVVGVMAAAAGRGLMAAGARIAGPAVARSAGGQALRTGAVKVGLEGKALDYLKEGAAIAWANSKVLKTLEKSSPALAQQMIIFRKSFMLILRPIGDIMAKFLRPMAIWMIKFATKWYQIFGTGGADSDSKQAKEDKQKQIKTEIESAKLLGDENKVSSLERELQKLKSPLERFAELFASRNWEDVKNWGKNIWADYVAPAWEKVLDWPSEIWDKYVGVSWSEAVTWASDIWTGFIVPGWETATTWADDVWKDYISPGWDLAKTWASKIWKDYLSQGWEGAKSWASTLWNDYIVPGWDGVKNWASKLYNILSGAFSTLGSKIKSWAFSLFKKDKSEPGSGSWAVGGKVEKSGLYNLHAGEEVIRAGDVSSMSNSSNITSNNYFTINANISSDLDIRTIAKKLAEYQEVEIRRRTSYI